jgi:hypothetical protein
MTKPSFHAHGRGDRCCGAIRGPIAPQDETGRVRYARARAQSRPPTEAISVPAPRLQHLVRQIHVLGERPLFELFRELERGAVRRIHS